MSKQFYFEQFSQNGRESIDLFIASSILSSILSSVINQVLREQ